LQGNVEAQGSARGPGIGNKGSSVSCIDVQERFVIAGQIISPKSFQTVRV